MATETSMKLGNIKDKHFKTVLGRTIQGILVKDNFDDQEQFNDAINVNLFTNNDSNANHVTSFDSSNSRAEMDGSTSIGSARITTTDRFGQNVAIKVKLQTNTLTPDSSGSVFSCIRIYENATRYVKFGSFKDGVSPDSYAYVKFYDYGESTEQTYDFAPGATSSINRWYKIIFVEDNMFFYTREGDSGAWTYHGSIAIVGIDKYRIDLMVESEAAADSYANVYWQKFSVTTLDYDLMEEIQDQVEVSETTAGTFGVLGGGFPTGEDNRHIFWVDGTNGSATYDGKTAATAKASIDAGHNLMSRGDVLLVKYASQYDENANTGGVILDTGGVHIYGLGTQECGIVNSNGGATAIFTDTSGNNEIAGFMSNESTTTVEFYVLSGTVSGSYLHHNHLRSAMENGFHVYNTGTRSIIEHNDIYGMTNDGLEVSGVCTRNIIRYNQIDGCGDSGIHLNGDNADSNVIYGNIINGSAGAMDYGITVTLGDGNIIVKNYIGECGTAPIFDSGSNNIWHNKADGITGNFNRTVANGTSEITSDIDNVDLWTTGKFNVQLDCESLNTANEGGTVTFVLYRKVDGSNYVAIGSAYYLEGVDRINPCVEGAFKGGDSKLRVSHQCSSAVTANRQINYAITQVD